MKNNTVYLIRHGQSEANLRRLWGGDYPLTDKGINDALTVPGKIPVEPQKIVSSALKRAQMTAGNAYPDREIEVNPAFNEIRFGVLEDTPMTSEDFTSYHYDMEGFLKKCGGDDPVSRAKEAISEILNYARKYESTAIFASEMIFRSVIATLRRQTLKEVTQFYIINCGVITLEYDGHLHIVDDSAITKRKV